MKILYFIAYPQRMAGANRSLLDLVTGIAGRCQVLVLVTGEGPVADAYRAAGLRVRVMPPPGALNIYGKALAKGGLRRRVALLADLLGYTRRLAALLRDEKVDVVHVNNMRAGLLAGVAARLQRVPIVGHVRGELSVGPLFSAAYELISHRLVSVSEQVRKSLGPIGRRKAVTVYNGINDSVIVSASRRIPWLESQRQAGKVVFAYFASVVPFKGHSTLVEAMARLNADGFADRYTVLCLGDFVPEYAAYQGLLCELQNRLAVDNLSFAGWQQNPFDFYPLADVCLLVSANSGRIELGGRAITLKGNEGFPRTILEAMLFGKAVIGTDNAGVCEQIEDGQSGLLIPPLDPAALASAMRRLIEAPEARARMGAAAAAKVRERFSSRACQDGVFAVYRELVPDA